MKKLLLLLTAILTGCNLFAQSSLVATLNHDGTITAFYGSKAIAAAHASAESGDVITLSSGSFESCDITKAITLRGAGMEYNDGIEPTVIQGDFLVNCENDSVNVFKMEGIYHYSRLTLSDVYKSLFFKCNLYEIDGNTPSGQIVNASFVNSKIRSWIYFGQGDNATFNNCVVFNPRKYYANGGITEATRGHFTFENCLVNFTHSITNVYPTTWEVYSHPIYLSFSTLRNCIIYTLNFSSYSDSPSFPSSTTLYNNIGNNEKLFSKCINSTNTVVTDFFTLFKTWEKSDYDEEETYELTDDAASKYLGQDGTQVGIYGGTLPYDPVTSHPKITKCNVASKTTSDGKLSVDIEVKGADY